ncbi:MAG: ribosome biogenesis GTPase Der [Candidatus Krumholzibacteriia bacterium]
MRKRATVAIVGRPNVGKSTLFNRILRRREAVVHDVSGVTRDRHYGATTWNDQPFYVVDTGGLLPRAREGMEALVRESALVALAESDLLLVVVDVNTGITDLDLELAQLVQRQGKPALVVVNKADDAARAAQAGEFYRLGLGEPIAISAMHGQGTAELLDRVVAHLPKNLPTSPVSDAELRVAIIGKPNVGKSSLVNALLGEERALVSEEPGTTRDSIDSRLRWHDHTIDLVDTAGLRRRAQQKHAVDVFVALRALRSIERADVCLLLLDASLPISHQDTRVAGHAHKAGKGIVVCFNKWDLVEKDTATVNQYRRDFEREFAFIRYAPLLFVSVQTRQRVHKLLETAWMVGEARARQVVTSRINRVLDEATRRHPPHYHGGGNGHVKYGLQVAVKPPRFAVYVNNPDYFDRAYIRYLNNALRSAFEFPGTALRIELRASPGRRAREGAETT